MIREEIKNLVKKSIKKLHRERVFPEFDIPEIKIEHPEEKSHGDYATNLAMLIAKQIRKNPIEIAEMLTEKLKNQKTEKLFKKIEVAKPGFINFFLSKEYLQKQVGEILREGEKFGQLNIGKRIKTQIEFISANPTGPLHIGNGRGAFFGDTLANVLERAGYKVIREYYINEAKANTQIRILGQTALGKGVSYLNEYLKEKISRLRQDFGGQTNLTEGEAGYLLAQEVQKDTKDFIEKKLKIKFDSWVSEEDLYKRNEIKKNYQWLKKQNLIYKKEGAEWLKISEFGASKDEVIVRQTGEPTYFLSDIAYHKDKFNRGFQKIINIWGADHQGHVPKIKAVAKILEYEGDLDILISQIVRLKGGMKLSKRKGATIALEWLIDEVGLEATRFFYLMKSLDTQMEFDLQLAKEKSEKSPVYYVQYAHARICAILRKFGKSEINSKFKILNSELSLLNHPSEMGLIKQLIRLPEVVEDIARDYQVQRVPQYAIDLATSFHQFYRDCRVLRSSDQIKTKEDQTGKRKRGSEELSRARLSLILATKIVLQSTFNLMGISAPEKM